MIQHTTQVVSAAPSNPTVGRLTLSLQRTITRMAEKAAARQAQRPQATAHGVDLPGAVPSAGAGLPGVGNIRPRGCSDMHWMRAHVEWAEDRDYTTRWESSGMGAVRTLRHVRAGVLRAALDDGRRNPPGPMYAMLGPEGVGKTQFAACLCREWMLTAGAWIGSAVRHHMAHCTTAASLLAASRAYGDESARSDLGRAQTCGLLVIDEIGRVSMTEHGHHSLFGLLDCRYGDGLATIILGNLTADAFGAMLGDALSARIAERGGVVVCDWPSYRRRGKGVCP